jgi:hypothetical protein
MAKKILALAKKWNKRLDKLHHFTNIFQKMQNPAELK